MTVSRILFEGVVQGVFFRRTVQTHATDLGCQGWVRNLTDGRVEALVVAGVEMVEQLIARCRSQNGRARVDGVEISDWSDPASMSDGFEIRPTVESPLLG